MSDIYLTKDGFTKIQQELVNLKHQKEELFGEIEEARLQGDLKENAGYIYAKEKQNLVMKRIGELEITLRTAKIVGDGSVAATGDVRFGATVTMRDENTKATMIYTLASADEADPSVGKISVSSPLAQGILGATAGKTVSVKLPSGEKHLAILKVEYK